MGPRYTKKLVAGALVALVLGSVWFYFAPASVGGSTNWVVTDGISMEPRFHAGDLVLVRAQSDYRVGEIVAYHNDQLHTIVLHRIIGRAGSRYIFKGDNNNFVDFEHPARSQLIGAKWLHLAGVGSRLESLRSPLLIGGLFALATIIFAGAAFTRRQRRRRRQRRAEGGAPHRPVARPRQPQAIQVTILAVGLLALLPFVSLAVLSFTRPAESLVETQAPYEQHAALTYTARAQPGPVYPNDTARTGDPLFTRVLRTVAVNVAYRLDSAAPHRASGRISLVAVLQSAQGWHRTIALGSPTSFHGSSARASATLNLETLLALTRSVEASTGVRSTYTLTLTPRILTRGTLDGLPLHASFAPPFAFTLNPLELQPIVHGSGGSAGRPPASAFMRSEGGTASGRRAQPMHISLGLFEMEVATAREIALGGVAIISCVIAALLGFVRPRRRDESAAIRARYGGLIIPVERVWQQPGVAVIDVADIEALVRIAEHYDRSILHELTDYGEAFWVTDESGQFRFWIGAAQERTAQATYEPVETVPGEEFSADTAPTLEFAVHAQGNGGSPSNGAPRNGDGWTGEWESVQHNGSGVEPGQLPG